MAVARQRAEWLRVGVSVAYMLQPHAKEAIDPTRIIPPPYRPLKPRKRVLTAKELEAESKQAWHALHCAFSR